MVGKNQSAKAPSEMKTILSDLSDTWTTTEVNTRLVGLQPVLIVNRLVWLCVGAAVLAWTYRRFRLAHTGPRIDMRATQEVDASGLGTLVVIQKRARERGVATLLIGAQDSIRSLLTATRLAPLFDFQ